MKLYISKGNSIKKISKKSLIEQIGKEKVDKMIKEGKETFMEDPSIQIEYITSVGNLIIEFM